MGLQWEAAKRRARAAIMQVGHQYALVRVTYHVVAPHGNHASKVEIVREDRGVRTNELRWANGELVVHNAPEPVWYPMAAGERVVLGWLADEKAPRRQAGSGRSHPLDQRPVQGSGVYVVKPRTHDEPEGAPTEHLMLQRHTKGQPDVPEHRGERVARFVLELSVPLPLHYSKEESAHYPAAARAVLGGVLDGLARAPVVRLQLVSEHIGGVAI
eukprot:scaffold20494_cov69-Phaeocystis_antarctica.AAC.2